MNIQTSDPKGVGAADAWISVKEAMPPEHCPPLLITNSINSRNSFGHMSHVWVAHMLHTADDGEVYAYAHDSDRRIWGVTHWAAIGAALAHQQGGRAVSIRSFIGLCEHRWQDEHDIVKKAGPQFDRIIEIRRVQRCTVCGRVRSVSL